MTTRFGVPVQVPVIAEKVCNLYKLLAHVPIVWVVRNDVPTTIMSDGNKIQQILTFGLAAWYASLALAALSTEQQ